MRTGGVGTTATVSYATQDDSASAGSDYVAASGTLTFGPATTSLPITVTVNGDTVDEPNERFLLRLSGASGASVGQPDGWATIVDDDAGVAGQRHEVSHGLVSRRDFAAAPQHLYAMRQERYASYEVIVDAPFGRGGAAQGPPLARVAADGTTVVQSSTAVGTGHSRQLRFLNDASAAQQAQFIRVQAGGCPTGCTAADGYRLRAYETTYTIPRFNNSATQGTVVVVHNPTTRTVALRLRFWSASGSLLFTQSQNVAPRGVYTLATNSIGGAGRPVGNGDDRERRGLRRALRQGGGARARERLLVRLADGGAAALAPSAQHVALGTRSSSAAKEGCR